MQITKKQFLIFSLLLLFSFFLLLNIADINPAQANTKFWESQEGMEGSESIGSKFGAADGKPIDVRVVVGRLIRIFLEFLGIVFLVLIIVAGFKWMTSQGNEETVKNAKSQLQAAAIGLIIILISYSVVYFIDHYVVREILDTPW